MIRVRARARARVRVRVRVRANPNPNPNPTPNQARQASLLYSTSASALPVRQSARPTAAPSLPKPSPERAQALKRLMAQARLARSLVARTRSPAATTQSPAPLLNLPRSASARLEPPWPRLAPRPPCSHAHLSPNLPKPLHLLAAAAAHLTARPFLWALRHSSPRHPSPPLPPSALNLQPRSQIRRKPDPKSQTTA